MMRVLPPAISRNKKAIISMRALLDRLQHDVHRHTPIRRRWPEFRPPTTPAVVDHTEHQLGVQLPTLLRAIYLHIGNGGFGPGRGGTGVLLGLDDGQAAHRPCINTVYRFFRTPDPTNLLWEWPDALIPFCSWGCDIYSCLDCTQEGAPVMVFDGSYRFIGYPFAPTLMPHKPSFEAWLEAWLNGADLDAEIANLERPPVPQHIQDLSADIKHDYLKWFDDLDA